MQYCYMNIISRRKDRIPSYFLIYYIPYKLTVHTKYTQIYQPIVNGFQIENYEHFQS